MAHISTLETTGTELMMARSIAVRYPDTAKTRALLNVAILDGVAGQGKASAKFLKSITKDRERVKKGGLPVRCVTLQG